MMSDSVGRAGQDNDDHDKQESDGGERRWYEQNWQQHEPLEDADVRV